MNPPPKDYSEDTLVEKPAVTLFETLGFMSKNCYHEQFGENGTIGRENRGEVVLVPRLQSALQKLNPQLPITAIQQAIEELTRDRRSVSSAEANREIHQLLKNGVRVTVKDEEGERAELVQVIDWNNPNNNDYFLASQLWVTGDVYTRRTDLIGFVNGLPIVFVELKASHKRLEHAYQHNLTDYKHAIPQLFWYNALIILSNGSASRIGTLTAGWEHFAEWKRINDEGEEGVVSLETVIRGTCNPLKLLDLVENFILFSQEKGGLIKILAKNHQYLGVNNAIDAFRKVKKNEGRLGVFWHTQGSGKSYSMIFFSQKVLRKFTGNYTFLVVTDRTELDGQIYKNFANAGVVTEKHVQAESSAHLKQLLWEDHRLIFTLIQKFRTERGGKYPKLTDRSDVIVITDEAHRSQYDIFASNMRTGLPKAAFIGFTGTPLIIGEERTREVFGDYVSVYNFRQSVQDGATVQLFYENRIPELQLTNQDLNTDMEDLLEAAELDDAQERKLEREFAREYHLVTRDDRLNKIADDIVAHFINRGYLGKGMVVSIDKLTAVRMHDKVQERWAASLEQLKKQATRAAGSEKAALGQKIKFMQDTEMAVVVSQSQNEVALFRKKGLDIAPHRKRMMTEDLETKFKDASDPFRLVFVCAMWMTGFDVPNLSTIYLDKPMRNHTLMQAIARANRVFGEKTNGVIVDYIGVFRNLQKALAIYGSSSGGGVKVGEWPVEVKEKLILALRNSIIETEAFCTSIGIDCDTIIAARHFQKVRLLKDAVDAILVNDETKTRFLSQAARVNKLYKAILPDPSANEFLAKRTLFMVLTEKIKSEIPDVDISEFMSDVESLLDASIATEAYVIAEPSGEGAKLIDLTGIDFDALKKRFAKGHKHTEAARVRALLSQKITRMVRANQSRLDYLEKFQKLIDEYNSGSSNIETFFDELLKFAGKLDAEEKRGIAVGLSEEELAVFDILTRPDLKLTKKEETEVKKVAKELLDTLKRGKLSLDWRKHQQGRARIVVTIQQVLDELPEKFTRKVYAEKCDRVYQHVYDSYFGGDQSIYAETG